MQRMQERETPLKLITFLLVMFCMYGYGRIETAHGQQSELPPAPMTLLQAIEYASEHYPAVR